MGHGLVVGACCGAGLFLAGVIALAAGARVHHGGLWLLAALTMPPLVALIAGTATAHRVGVDADDLGLHSVPASPRSFAPWASITDVRIERHRNRMIVAVYLDSGGAVWLRAPYDGGMLAHDPRFERKFFALVQLWETHRNRRSRT